MRRAGLLLAILGLFQCALGQGYLGTKTGGVVETASSSSSSSGTFIQMLVALVVVVALLKFALPKLATKMGSRLTTSVHGTLKVEESAGFPGGTLYVVRARSKTLLLGVNSTNVVCLADLSEPPEQESAPKPFQEIVQEQVQNSPSTPHYQAVAEVPLDPDMQAAEQLIERLTRLGA